MNVKENCRQLIIEARPHVDELESPATIEVCDKLRHILDQIVELSINMQTGTEHEQTG